MDPIAIGLMGIAVALGSTMVAFSSMQMANYQIKIALRVSLTLLIVAIFGYGTLPAVLVALGIGAAAHVLPYMIRGIITGISGIVSYFRGQSDFDDSNNYFATNQNYYSPQSSVTYCANEAAIAVTRAELPEKITDNDILYKFRMWVLSDSEDQDDELHTALMQIYENCSVTCNWGDIDSKRSTLLRLINSGLLRSTESIYRGYSEKELVYNILEYMASYHAKPGSDPITLEDIAVTDKFVALNGQAYSMSSLIDYHHARDYRGTSGEQYQSKFILNPLTNQPFSHEDTLRFLKRCGELNLSITHLNTNARQVSFFGENMRVESLLNIYQRQMQEQDREVSNRCQAAVLDTDWNNRLAATVVG